MGAVNTIIDGVKRSYDPVVIEESVQARWSEAGLPSTPPPSKGRADTYVFVTPPFTSGDPHMGHVRSYTIGDAYARFRRAEGDAVLYSLGFDAFGLPSELAAIERGMNAREWVEHCRARMQEHFIRLGLSFDWSRSFSASDPEIYKWTQWLFLNLFEADLVYRKEGQVEWCDSCGTVLANLQVEDGRCWRCHGIVRLVHRAQWYLRRTAYNEENSRRLNDLKGWSKLALAAQRAVLGEIPGVELDAKGIDGVPFTVFTPFEDAIGEAEFVLLSPSHPEIERWLLSDRVRADLEALRRGAGRREERRQAQAAVLDTRMIVTVPGVNDPLPLFISPSVDARFGPTAVLGIPSRDRTDAAIATECRPVARSTLKMSGGHEKSRPRPATRFQATDFTISRQRAWGAPIPLVYCGACGTVPVPEDQLPVLLPDQLPPAGAGLDTDPSFYDVQCPRCGSSARRETDTLDCHIDAAWTMLPLAIPATDRSERLFSHPELRRWLPVKQMVQGGDTGGFILNMRLVAKALRDLGVVEIAPDGEPFEASLMHEMVLLDGRKMSKHLENGVSPTRIMGEFGADAVRFAVLYAAAPAKSFSWNEHALRYCARFLEGLWDFAEPRLSAAAPMEPDASIDTSDKLRARLDLWCETGTEKICRNYEQLQMHQATRNAMRFVERIRDFVGRAEKTRGELEPGDDEAVAIALLRLVQMLAPIAPHITDELWFRAGREGLIGDALWPQSGVGP